MSRGCHRPRARVRAELIEYRNYMDAELTVDSCIRGYHVFKNVWTPTVGEQLTCQREIGNNKDRYAVVILRNRTTVGHVPRKISAACALFLQRKGSIHCVVTGGRCYSRDLPQGGLEVPCVLQFKGQPEDVLKLKKLLSPAGIKSGKENVQPPTKKRKIDLDPTVIDDYGKTSKDEDQGESNI